MQYRPEIDGLRAVAVIPVILFHAGFSAFSGGYVGVDVFFVISGYLITSIIKSEVDGDQFSLLNFYERRARRILPALFVMLFVCIPIALLLIPPTNLKDFFSSTGFSSIFLSNYYFMSQVNYFGLDGHLQPLVHTWSLAVEVQFYLFFPMMFKFVYSKWRNRTFLFLLSIAFLSLAAAQYGSQYDPERNYFHAITRFWEFILGALVAFLCVDPRFDFSNLTRNFISLLGISSILIAVFWFDSTVPFPGVYTTLPTLGAALVILSARPGVLLHAALSQSYVLVVGVASYSLYLWHQPILAFLRYAGLEYTQEPTVFFTIAILLTCLSTALSYYLVEKRLRLSRIFSAPLLSTYSAILFAGSLIVYLYYEEGSALARYSKEEQKFLQSTSTNSLRSVCSSPAEPCRIHTASDGANPHLLILGDSHSRVILPAFKALGEAQDWTISHSGENGCPPLAETFVLESRNEASACKELFERQVAYADEAGVDAVVLVARWVFYLDDHNYGVPKKSSFLGESETAPLSIEASRRTFEAKFKETIEMWRGSGTKVFVMQQVPQQKFTPSEVLGYALSLRESGDLKMIGVARPEYEALHHYSRDAIASASQADVTVIDLEDYFCSASICSMFRREGSLYLDDDHLSAFGAEAVAPWIFKYFE